jgi:hypothetical protein
VEEIPPTAPGCPQTVRSYVRSGDAHAGHGDYLIQILKRPFPVPARGWQE